MTARLVALDLTLPGRLQSTSLTADAGQLVCLVGPNGSGKTSLLHALARIGSAGGQVRIDGTTPDGLPPRLRQALLGFLPAGREPHWPMRAGDVVALGLPQGTNIDEAVGALELEPLLNRTVDRLSTGERSRVLIARALAARPKLLLLDEPTANLDPLWQLKLMDLLHATTRAHGTTMIVAMHDLDLAGRHADRMIVIQSGRIAADGEPATLLGSAVMSDVFGIRRAAEGWIPA